MIMYYIYGLFLASALVLLLVSWKWGRASWSEKPAEKMIETGEDP